MLRITAPLEGRIFRSARKNAMRPDVDILAAILIGKNAAIAGHENGNRIRKQQQPRGQRTGGAVETGVLNAGILQVYRVHQMVQSDMGIRTA